MEKPKVTQWLQEQSFHSIPRWDLSRCLACLRISDATIGRHLYPGGLPPQEIRDAIIQRICLILGQHAFELPYQDKPRGKRGPYNTMRCTLVVDTVNSMQNNIRLLCPAFGPIMPEPLIAGSTNTMITGLQTHLDRSQSLFQYLQWTEAQHQARTKPESHNL